MKAVFILRYSFISFFFLLLFLLTFLLVLFIMTLSLDNIHHANHISFGQAGNRTLFGLSKRRKTLIIIIVLFVYTLRELLNIENIKRKGLVKRSTLSLTLLLLEVLMILSGFLSLRRSVKHKRREHMKQTTSKYYRLFPSLALILSKS